MFKILIGLKEKGSFQTFSEAVGAFMAEIREIMKKQGGLSLMWIQTTNYIEHDVFVTAKNITVKCALNFSDTRDIAHRLGLMKNGQMVANPPEVSPLLVDMIFYTVFTQSVSEMLAKLEDIRDRLLKNSKSPEKVPPVVYEIKIIND